jgi:hypothetical protein
MKNLVELIKKNPRAVFVVDNDCWYMYASQEDKDNDQHYIASDGDVKKLGDGGYGSGNCYGGDILQALAKIVGVQIESV